MFLCSSSQGICGALGLPTGLLVRRIATASQWRVISITTAKPSLTWPVVATAFPILESKVRTVYWSSALIGLVLQHSRLTLVLLRTLSYIAVFGKRDQDVKAVIWAEAAFIMYIWSLHPSERSVQMVVPGPLDPLHSACRRLIVTSARHIFIPSNSAP